MAEYIEFHCPHGDDFEGGDECDRCEQYELCMEIYPPVNLIEIPKGATNGDMIKAMFPNIDKYHNMLLENHSKNILFNDDWWNAPYKEVEQ